MIKKHWNLNYFLAKLKLKIINLLHPDYPWLTEKSIRILNHELKRDFIGFEFGSGRSTLWLSKRIKFLTSVEHSEEYYIKVNKEIAQNNIINCSLLHLTGEDYYKILQSQSDFSIDFIMIDGVFRDKLLEIALQKISKRGIICFDNANLYLVNKKSTSPGSIKIIGKAFENSIPKLQQFELNWTTNGVWDTLIIKHKNAI
jgi:predicted O-methyltransferase YrrM